MSPSSDETESFLREHLPRVRASEGFEEAVLALAALTRLPVATPPVSFEDNVFRQAKQHRFRKFLVYSCLGLAVVGSIGYGLLAPSAPAAPPFAVVHTRQQPLLLPSDVTPPAVHTLPDPVQLESIAKRIKHLTTKNEQPYGVAGH